MATDFKRIYAKGKDPFDPSGNYNGFCPSITVLPKGFIKKEGYAPIPCDILWVRDAAVKLRDGTTMYTDIFRPCCDEPVPVIISWSPYGKSNLDVPWAYTDPTLSHLQKEEGVDPALWCLNGYAVAHPDPRGVYMSEGNIEMWGSQEAQDMHDYIEWLASCSWCSGKVGMAGNSYLAISQWFAAGEKPEHLAAIAPWEGMSDAFRDSLLKGGIPDVEFPRHVVLGRCSNNYVDDVASMAEMYPLMNDYWRDKIPKFENIDIPTYVVASYTNFVHTDGTFRAFRKIKSEEKWLRIHNSHEWVDFYKPENQKELMKFFDFFLKGIKNDWSDTPKVRISLLNPGNADVVGRAEDSFPPKGTEYRKLFLNAASNSLDSTLPGSSSSASYRSTQSGVEARFELIFAERTEIIGYPSVRLYLEADGHNDMDVFVMLSKADKDGNIVPWRDNPPNRYQGAFLGAMGRLRVSKRALDPVLSTPEIPEQSFEKKELLKAGEIACADIHIWPLGMVFEKGERLVLRIMPQTPYAPEVHGNEVKGLPLVNAGRHIIHCGKSNPSFLSLPVFTA